MSALPTLPVELKIYIFQYAFENAPEDLLNTIMSSKALHAAYQSNRPSVFQYKLGPLHTKEWAVAAAHYHATVAPWKLDKDISVRIPQDTGDYLEEITNFCERHLSVQGTELGTPHDDFTLPMVLHMLDMRAVMADIINQLCVWALIHDELLLIIRATQLESPLFPVDKFKIPSPSMYFDVFSETLYVIDLVRLLFLKNPLSWQHPGEMEADREFSKFWSYFSPLESARVECLTTIMADVIGSIHLQDGRNRLPSKRDCITFMMWNGLKGLVPAFSSGRLSKDDRNFFKRMRQDNRFSLIRMNLSPDADTEYMD